MKLHLKYNGHLHPSVKGAFIRSSDPLNWLQQIDHWKIDPNELNFFVMPMSIQSVEAAGLFVIFKSAATAKNIELLEPYTCIAKRLYIPCNATLGPQVQDKELNGLLLWDIQVFHPSIGIVGFAEDDKIQLQDICNYTPSRQTDWSFANPGLPDKPALERIIVVPASADEIMDSFKQEIGQKPINEIPVRDDEKRTVTNKLLDGLKTIFFSTLLGTVQIFDKLLPTNNSGLADSASDADNGKGGVLRKIENWLTHNLADLQKKRNDEVQRLLNLFDHDTNEALQFAIPLNSPYFNRGSQSISSKLSRNLPKFNLGKLGGGTAIDGWDLGSNYNELRTKYLEAARQEIARKDFKKAAYVYAHLLGDYHNAANVLEQGNLYREAAALYKDHLKNIQAAAKCLENGGLYIEAIDLYKDLQQEEKVGDLYTILQQEDNAVIHFENSINVKIENNDHLDAARVINEKLVQEERAKQTLLQGWKKSHQFEPCLKKYFDILAKGEEAPIQNALQDIYKQHTTESKKLPLLNVMEHINRGTKNKSLLNATQEIAYEIVHDQVEKGNMPSLHRLKNFLPGDKLIGADASRYSANNNLRSGLVVPPQQIQLDSSIDWIKTTVHRNQFLVIGIKNNHLQLARVNWYGNVEYYSWESRVESHTPFDLITAPYHTNQVILHTFDTIPIARRSLPRNKYFNEALLVNCPIWLHRISGPLLISDDNKIFRLDNDLGALTLNQYSKDGDLLNSVNCLFKEDTDQLDIRQLTNSYMAFHDGFFYTYAGMNFLTVAADGQSKSINLQTGIRSFSASEYTSEFHIVISTNKGCCLCKPNKGELNFTGDFFATKMIPVIIAFVAAKRFVVVEKLKATVFEIVDEKPGVIYEVFAECPIIGILPGTARGKFGTVEANGKIISHSIT